MIQKFKLRDEKGMHLAKVLYFFEDSINDYVGIIFSSDVTRMAQSIYQNQNIDFVIKDLAEKIQTIFFDYVEVPE